MNISKRALSLALVAASIGFLNVPAAHGSVSVVSYWRLGEHDPSAVPGLVATNTLDSVGGNTITFTGSPTYSSNVSASAAMDVGSTVCIGFTNGYYGSCPTVSSAVDNFGIEMWVNSANTSGNQCLAYNGNTSSSGWGLYQFGGNYGGLIGGKAIFGSGAITPGVWTHLALVRNNGTMTFYVNGVASGTATATPGVPTSGFALAAPPTSPTKEMFTGLLDEVRVFTFAAGQFNTNDLLLSFIPPPPAIITTNWHFANTGPMAVSRRLAPALLLTNGQVLTAGGEGNGTDAEIYDLRSGSWTNTAPTSIDRIGTTGTLLENGRVLLAGGYSLSAGFVSGCEIYDPVTATWSTNTGSLNSVRFYHSAVLLTNGNVLVAGGENSSFVPTASAEVYNPTTGTWTNTDSMANAREHHGMTLLPDGRVLVAGGDGEDIGIRMTAEIYNPVTGHWTNTPPLNVARDYVTTTLLTNGQVLVTGGGAASGEVYDPVANTWTLTGPMSVGRLGNTATLLPNGQVLVTGGLQDSADSYASTEVYNPGTGTWTNGASMNIGRRYHAATLLPNGQVLISGGDLGLSLTAAAELYVAPESAPPLVAGRRLNGGTFQISFTNAPSALFNVLATPDLLQPMTNWTVLGNAIEGPAGHFQWSDAPATNGMNRFYKIRNQ